MNRFLDVLWCLAYSYIWGVIELLSWCPLVSGIFLYLRVYYLFSGWGYGVLPVGLWVYVSHLFEWLVGCLLLFLVLGMWVLCLILVVSVCMCFCPVLWSVSHCYVFGGLVQLGVKFFRIYCWYLVEFLHPCDELLKRVYIKNKSVLLFWSIQVHGCKFLLPSSCKLCCLFFNIGLATLFLWYFEDKVRVAWLQFPDLHFEVVDANEGCGYWMLMRY